MLKNFILFIAALLCTACITPSGAQKSKDGRVTNYTDCQLSNDQGKGSFIGAWASLPIPIILDKDFYLTDNGAAMPALRGAVNTWNYWANIRGLRGFTLVNDGSGVTAGMDIPAITSCSQAAYSAAVTEQVGIWKITSYGDGKNSRADCGTNGKILVDGVQGQADWIILNGNITGASVLLNFEGFNAPGMRKIDVESLLLHELGHVLGLLHSCRNDGLDGTTSPTCDSASSVYRSAVMFPTLDVGQQRRSLQQNDYSRINCLY